MKKMTTTILSILLAAGMTSCIDNDGASPATHSVAITSIELENKDNGQPIALDSQSITGSVWIEE
jgi:hypothetical protein